MRKIVTHPFYTYYMYLISAIALVQVEVMNIFFSPSADIYFTVLNIYILFHYIMDVYFSFRFVKSYPGSFYFYFDLASSVVLIGVFIIQKFQ